MNTQAASAGAATVSQRAHRSPRAWALLLLALAVALGLDLWTKALAFSRVGPRPVVFVRDQVLDNPAFDPVPYGHTGHQVIPGVLQLRLVINRGAVFGIAANQRAFFIGFTLLALVAGMYVFRKLTTANAWNAHLGLGMAVAGGLGNLYDRLQLGAVRDFIQLFPGHRLPEGWYWPGDNPEMFPWVFNLADVFLLVGMVMLMVHLNRQDVWKRRARRHQAHELQPVTASCEGDRAA